MSGEVARKRKMMQTTETEIVLAVRGGKGEKNDGDNGNRDSAGSEKMAMIIQTEIAMV